MGIRLTFGPSTRVFSSGPVTVGQGTENDFSVCADGIADRHAVFREIQGKWLVESACDLLLTVGDGRPTRVAWLGTGDKVHLTSSEPELAFEVVATGHLERPVATSDSPAVSQEDRPFFWPPQVPLSLVVAGGFVAVLVVAALVYWRSQPAVSPKVVDGPSQPAHLGPSAAGVVSGNELPPDERGTRGSGLQADPPQVDRERAIPDQ